MVKRLVRTVIRRCGYEVVKIGGPRPEGMFPYDFSPEEVETYLRVRPYTLTPPERVVALCRAVEYLVHHEIPGAIVECGVWKGGSVLAVLLTLMRLGRTDRPIFLFDTFDRLPEPTAVDGDYARTVHEGPEGITAPLDAVKATLAGSGYPLDRITFVRGRVEETIPAQAPEQIALLRLDTDLYESTRHELVHLYPRLVSQGVLILDDYGCPMWPGAGKATDEFLQQNAARLFLNRIDADARLAIKS